MSQSELSSQTLHGSPRYLERSEHNISRKDLDPDALKVLYRLAQSNYLGYLVGGGVRDMLLSKTPKDYDVGTDARTETVRRLFRNSRMIGRRFKINHVYFHGGKIIEVATFRDLVEEPITEQQLRTTTKQDNTYGTPETDALRRDLTINGLFYDISSYRVIDYVGGIDDLRAGIIRIIRDPNQRIQEDPVRMIRAIRHAARTGFTIEPKTFSAICANARLIELSSKPRVHEEFMRELKGGYAAASFEMLKKTGLLPYLIPLLSEIVAHEGEAHWHEIQRRLTKIDRLSIRGTELSQSVLYASLVVGNIQPRHLGEVDHSFLSAVEPFFLESEMLHNQAQDQTRSNIGVAEGIEEVINLQKTGGFKKQQSLLMRAINQVFLPLGVTKREREKLEAILCLRYRLLCEPHSEKMLREVARLPHLNDTLALIRLTSSSPFGKQLTEKIEPLVGEIKDQSPNKRRRRTRGGRKKQVGQN